MLPVTLRTARLVLAPPTEADVDAIAAGASDPEVPRWTVVPSPYTRADAEDFVEKTTRWWDEGTEFTWAIHLADGFAGMIGLHRAAPGGSAEIGYWMAPAARGKGYLVEAARAVVDFGFAPGGLALVRIEWRASVGNVPSARAARALGFRYEGLLRQALTSPRGRYDGWIAGLLATDDRTPVAWPVLK